MNNVLPYFMCYLGIFTYLKTENEAFECLFVGGLPWQRLMFETFGSALVKINTNAEVRGEDQPPNLQTLQ